MGWEAWIGPCGWIFPVFCLAMMLVMFFSFFGGSRCFPWQREEKKGDEDKKLREEISELKEMVKGLKEKLDKQA